MNILNFFLKGPVVLFRWSKNNDWPILFVSQNVKEVLGYNSSEFLDGNLRFKDLIHPDDISHVENQVFEAQKKEKNFYEFDYFRLKRKDGKYIWIYDYNRLSENNSDYVDGYILDVTDKVEKEVTITGIKNMYDTAMTINKSAIIEINKQNNTIIASPNLKDLIGFDFEEINYAIKNEFNNIDYLKESYRKMINSLKRYNYWEEKIKIESKNEKWLSVTAQKHHESIIILLKDITDIVKLQRDIVMNKSFFEKISEGLMIVNTNKQIIRVNGAFSKITGYNREEIIGKSPKVLSSSYHDKDFYENMWMSIRKNGYWSGTIWDKRKDGELIVLKFNIFELKESNSVINGYIGIFNDITIERKAQSELEIFKRYDPLTELPNQEYFIEKAQMLINENKLNKYALLLIDIKNFSTINNTYGFLKGDKLIKAIKKRLMNFWSKDAIISRFSTNEFCIFTKNNMEKDLYKTILELLNILIDPFVIDKNKIILKYNIGISTSPYDSNDINELINSARMALYAAKRSGVNNYSFYSSNLYDKIQKRIKIENELEEAIKTKELEVYYQPQVSLKSGIPIGAEALIRWNHPELGTVSPGMFMKVAEESGLIQDIDIFVLKEVTSEIKSFMEKNIKIPISINISDTFFKNKNFLKIIKNEIENSNIDPNLLELELTETIMVENVEMVIKKLDTLKSFGIRLSIDDFGTGYSSLSYLRKFPIDKLKIDMSFIKDLETDKNSQEITSTIIAMAKNMRLKVLAEGVETDFQLNFLKEKSCDEIQGYYFSPPVRLNIFKSFIIK
ncbi:EAL domain-containing protein [Oceanotoga sp. DSM 15011]|uniref:EAL domain-containing protein n=1 Tax=Oceanotoga sp. DSM 15011 TaxID=2984951 RepID=UPI0021F4AE2C|nr:EAL domain-containing protein [Oceanotoga sp. DSM 15011]UYO98856.1 EAL domain-containing protein [Oceanotoga sp. DSM 15011]